MTSEQCASLEQAFDEDQFPDLHRCEQLASLLRATQATIEVSIVNTHFGCSKSISKTNENRPKFIANSFVQSNRWHLMNNIGLWKA